MRQGRVLIAALIQNGVVVMNCKRNFLRIAAFVIASCAIFGQLASPVGAQSPGQIAGHFERLSGDLAHQNVTLNQYAVVTDGPRDQFYREHEDETHAAFGATTSSQYGSRLAKIQVLAEARTDCPLGATIVSPRTWAGYYAKGNAIDPTGYGWSEAKFLGGAFADSTYIVRRPPGTQGKGWCLCFIEFQAIKYG